MTAAEGCRAASGGPFSTIESAQEFLALLGEAIDEALEDARRECSGCTARQTRRVEWWQLVLYKLSTLSSDVARSRRLVGELGALRGLLHQAAVGPRDGAGPTETLPVWTRAAPPDGPRVDG